MIFLCYPACTTCQRAKKWLEDNGIVFEERNIKENNPTYEELVVLYRKSNIPLRRFFNISGLLYKELHLKERLLTMIEEEQLRLLATNGMLIKRPLLITDKDVLVGFKEVEWQKTLLV